jgi:4-hydroxy-3-polyprenylbenzoate decarboxylase
MAYDMRNFVDDLRKAGELVEVDREATWNFEIPAFEVMSARIGGPAFLFNKITGCPETRLLVGGFAGTFRKPHKRVAIALGEDPNVDRFTWFRLMLPKMMNMLRPVEVATGPCKEIVKMGKDVNILAFPLTYHSLGDGGRAMLQNCTLVKDPDSDWINSGNYGIEIFSKNRLVITPYAHTNLNFIYSTKYELRNMSMPIAVCLGGDPVLTMVASTIAPPGVTEFDMAGGIRGVPVEMVRAETSDLLIPADAEVVFEGEIRPYERLPEGPRIESFGFSTGPRKLFYAIRVHCITHRQNPICYDTHASLGVSCSGLHDSFFAQGFYMILKMLGLPVRVGSFFTLRGGATQVYSMEEKVYPGFTQDLVDWIGGNPALSTFASHLLIDGDTDFWDHGDVFEAAWTQVNPKRDVVITPGIFPTMTVESSWMEEEDFKRYFRAGTHGYQKMITDATTKGEPPLGVKRTSFETLFPDELQKWVTDNWQRLGFKEEPRWVKPWIEAKV